MQALIIVYFKLWRYSRFLVQLHNFRWNASGSNVFCCRFAFSCQYHHVCCRFLRYELFIPNAIICYVLPVNCFCYRELFVNSLANQYLSPFLYIFFLLLFMDTNIVVHNYSSSPFNIRFFQS